MSGRAAKGLFQGVSPLVLAIATIGMAGHAMAAGAEPQEKPAEKASGPVKLGPVKVGGEGVAEDATYKPEAVASPKYTAPLLDTPQTITVIPEKVMKDQGLLTVKDILSTVPGITFGAGEGGGGYGDSINMRGYTASNDITVDGLRDSAQYTRSDSFNLEQIEIVNGSNSVYSGSGSLAGTINLVSKTPKDFDATTISGGIGTDKFGRITVDSNKVLTDDIAVRLNGMLHRNDVPGRDVDEYKRWGIAPSVTFGLHSDTKVTLSYIYQHDKNIPQYGVPYFVNAYNNGPIPEADPSNYYGFRNLDQQKIDAQSFTAEIRHDFNDNFSIRNIARWQQVKQYLVVDPPQGTWCLSNGINVATGLPCAAPNNAPGTYYLSGPRGNTRDTKNTMLVDQLDLTTRFDTGGLSHVFVLGASVAYEKYSLNSGNSLRNPDGVTPNPSLPHMNIANPDNLWDGPINFILTSKTRGDLNNRAIYAFDTIKLNSQFELNAGIRYEHNEGSSSSTASIDTPADGGAEVWRPAFEGSDNLLSYRAGLVYKPVENASLYISYSNSETPSQESVRDACGSVNRSGVLTDNCGVDPEKGVNYEIGGKLNLLDNQLSLTAALFRNVRSNYKVATNDPTLPASVQVPDGKARVQGIALGLAGTLTPDWMVFANYTYLDTKILQGTSDYCLANPTDADCITESVRAPKAGNPLTQTPKHALSLWTTYNLPGGFEVGYGFTYQGSIYLNNNDGPLYKSPDYMIHRAMLTYAASEQLSLQLNVNNLFDKEYYTRIRNNGWSMPGDGRSATLTANYSF